VNPLFYLFIANLIMCLYGFCVGVRFGRKQMCEELFAGIVMQKMNAAAQAIQPVVTLDNEFAKGARMAAKAIFAEFGIGYKEGGE
jgi:hypothetical protein